MFVTKMKGIYILLIKLSRNIQIKTGSLGKINFKKGIYAYVGSAQNNLEKRVKRHISTNKKMFWHIDYLLSNKFAKVSKVFYKKANKSEECRIASKLTGNPIQNFGSSDCNCKSHLVKIKNLDIPELEVKELTR